MIKAIIIDDEKFAREVIKEYLQPHINIRLLAEYSDGFSGLKAIIEHKPDLVFLDVQMPKLTGFEILEVLDEKPAIIFTTAFDQYAIRAFEENAIDYLLKPFSSDRFNLAISKLNLKSGGLKGRTTLEELSVSIDRNEEILNRIVVKNRNEIEIINVDDIYYIEAQDDYVMLHLENRKFLKQKTMNYFESHLDPNLFLRVHRSYIIRIDHIQKIEPYEKTSSVIVLKDGRMVPVSRAGLSKLKNKLGI